MKTWFFLFLAIGFCSLIFAPTQTQAVTKTVDVSFDWTPAPGADNIRQLTGFKLYKGGTAAADYKDAEEICAITESAARTLNCDTVFTAADVNADLSRVEAPFTLTATDNLGGESEHSPPVIGGFAISEIPFLPAPVNVNVSARTPSN